MKVLIISGTGWVGSHIAKACSGKGHDLTVLTRGLTKQWEMPENVKYIYADRSDEKAFRSLLKTIEAEVVIDVIPGYFGAENTQLIVDVFRGRIKQYLHCGSTGVYTPLRYVPGDEQHPCEPLPELGDAFIRKLDADKVVLEAVKTGFPATVLRPTCIMGEGMLPIDNWGNRTIQFLRDILNGKTRGVTGDGETLLQIVDVRDLAKAFALCIGREDIGPLYNISGYNAVPFNIYLSLICDILGKQANVEYISADEFIRRHGQDDGMSVSDFRFMCRHMCFSIEKARRELDYEPSFTLEATMKDTLEWALKQI